MCGRGPRGTKGDAEAMIVSIEASGAFPVAIYAVAGDFMRASKLHECGAAISLVEEMRQMGCQLPTWFKITSDLQMGC